VFDGEVAEIAAETPVQNEVSRVQNEEIQVQIEVSRVQEVAHELEPKNKTHRNQIQKNEREGDTLPFEEVEVKNERVDGYSMEQAVKNEGVIATGKSEEEAVKTCELETAQDVVRLWANLYRETYGRGYGLDLDSDSSLITRKLLTNFTFDQVAKIVPMIFREYGRRWAKAEYPRPTLGQLCSWLGKEALKLVEREQQERQDLERRMKAAEEEADEITDELLERLRNGTLGKLIQSKVAQTAAVAMTDEPEKYEKIHPDEDDYDAVMALFKKKDPKPVPGKTRHEYNWETCEWYTVSV
jgi:hypothetical protein